MSSEGSSRLRQFGLYKTIDTQTAEFLKLSRKRQIRRGCACAAVSTAITVTVVVSVVLIYEFGLHTDFKPTPGTSRQYSWFNVVNDSNALFDKHRTLPMNTKSNGKLLAIILKALDQKRYLETIVDENSSHRPSHEYITDYPFQKDIFTDARNRKIPIVYKPPRFIQNSRTDGLVKARKIMDYQRVINYLNLISLSKNTEETTRSEISSTLQPSMENFTNYICHHEVQASKPETKEARKINTEQKKDPRPKLCCKCQNRSNLTEILEKLYMNIQQLRPKVIEKGSINTKFNKMEMTKTKKLRQSKYKFSGKNNNIKRTTIPTNPNLKTATKVHSPVFNIRSKAKSSKIKKYEIKTDPNFDESDRNKYKEELVHWKLDLRNTIYAEPQRTDVITRNNSTTENSLISDVTVNMQYDLALETDNMATVSIQYSEKKEETSKYNDLANYLDGLSKLQTMRANKPLMPAASSEDLSVKQWDFKQLLTHEISNPLKLVPDSIEKPRTLKPTEPNKGFIKNNQDSFPTLDRRESAVTVKLKSGFLMKETTERPKSIPVLGVNNVDQNVPLTPMMQSYLISKKESGIILNLDQTTTTSIKLQTDSSEDLPFDIGFYEEDEYFLNLKTHTTPTVKCQRHKTPVNDSKVTSQEKERKSVPFDLIFDEEDEDFSRIKTHITKTTQQYNINGDVHASNLKTRITLSAKAAQHQSIYEDDLTTSQAIARTSIEKVTQHHAIKEEDTRAQTKKLQNINKDEYVTNKTHEGKTDKEARQRNINGDEHKTSLKAHSTKLIKAAKWHRKDQAKRLKTHLRKPGEETQLNDANISRDRIDNSNKEPPQKTAKNKAKVPRIQSSVSKPVEPRTPLEFTETTNDEQKRPKIKEIFYMTGDETPVDDFETKLSSMYFDEGPVNYTALANFFLNKLDTSIEASKSMMPETGGSHLEIRRNHEPVNFDGISHMRRAALKAFEDGVAFTIPY